MACAVIAYIVRHIARPMAMALYGLYIYGLYSYALYNYVRMRMVMAYIVMAHIVMAYDIVGVGRCGITLTESPRRIASAEGRPGTIDGLTEHL